MPEKTADADRGARLISLLRANRSAIHRAWETAVRDLSRDRAGCILAAIANETLSGTDLLAALCDRQPHSSQLPDAFIRNLIVRVHAPDWSLSDLHISVDSLNTALESIQPDEPDWIAATRMARQCLSRTMAAVIEQTATRQEQILESGPIAVCEFDATGDIVYLNKAMLQLLETDAAGHTRLEDFIWEHDHEFVQQALSTTAGAGTAMREIQLSLPNGRSKRIWLSIQPLIVCGGRVGSYATATDISAIIAREERFLDRLRLPAIKLDPQYVITYVNPATATLVGDIHNITGRSVYDIFPRSAHQSTQFEKRRHGEADLYETEVVRQTDGRKIPVSVAGTPILDSAGVFIGTLGIIRSLEFERTSQAIHDAIDTEWEEHSLLSKVAQLLRPMVPFDYLMVTQYSTKAEEVSRWFDYAADGKQIELARRWWPVAGERAQYETCTRVDDFEAFVNASRPELANDPDVRRYVQRGLRSMLRVPVWRGNQLVAAMVLLSNNPCQYTDADLKLIADLPLQQAVQMALYYKSRKDFEFRYELCKKMARLTTAKELAELLAKTVAGHYGWTMVSMLKVCKAGKILSLLAETSATVEPNPDPLRHVQALDTGITGYTYATGAPVNVPNVDDPEWSSRYVRAWPRTRSELCIPIAWDGEVQWICNIEDERLDAFSTDDQEELVSILDEVQVIVAQISRHYLLSSAFESSSDAFLITDTERNVLMVNSSAMKLLGFDHPKELRRPFQELFLDPAIADQVFTGEISKRTGAPAADVELIDKTGTPIPVLMSGSDLPEDLFRKIFVAKDMRVLRRLKKLEDLRKLFQDIGVQTHIPLALVSAWLKRLAKADPGNDAYPKILAQLKKLEITYDRLALCVDSGSGVSATFFEQLDIGVELKRVLDNFPEEDRNKISYNDPGELPYIQADQVQVTFIFASIISYLSRLCDGENSCVYAHMQQSLDRLTLVFTSPRSFQTEDSQRDPALARARFELALGEPTIKAFAVNNSADYLRKQDRESTVVQIAFAIPAS